MIHEEEIKPIHISDIEALEKAIIDDVTARRLVLLRQTIDACYHKKFMDKACEWLNKHINEKDALRDAFVILKQFKEFENISFDTFKKELIK